MQKLTFRSSKVIYYGPHACNNCGEAIVKMGIEFGGGAFDQPQGPIYPNTEWHIHICVTAKQKLLECPAPIPYPVFKGAICKGSFSLGSACGKCERCKWEKDQNRPSSPNSPRITGLNIPPSPDGGDL